MKMAQIGMREGRRRRIVHQREAEKSITEINRCRRRGKGVVAALRCGGGDAAGGGLVNEDLSLACGMP